VTDARPCWLPGDLVDDQAGDYQPSWRRRGLVVSVDASTSIALVLWFYRGCLGHRHVSWFRQAKDPY